MLPWPDYTHPKGTLNLAACLLPRDVPADIGPKSYIAYGRWVFATSMPFCFDFKTGQDFRWSKGVSEHTLPMYQSRPQLSSKWAVSDVANSSGLINYQRGTI